MRWAVFWSLLAACGQTQETPPAPATEPAPAAEIAPAAPTSTAPEPATPPPSSGGEAPDTVVVRHLLVSYTGAEHARNVRRSREEARARAGELLNLARAAGADFAAIARAESDGPSAALGGSLGEIGHGMVEPSFETAAFALPVGGISEVVETRFGFHVILRER